MTAAEALREAQTLAEHAAKQQDTEEAAADALVSIAFGLIALVKSFEGWAAQ